MIHIVIALDWVSTQTFYCRKYSNQVTAEAINVGGLVFAIFGMGVSLTKGAPLQVLPEKTGVIESEGMSLVYATKNPVIIVAAMDRKDNTRIARTKLKSLAKDFTSDFLEKLAAWREQSAGPSMFRGFDKTVDRKLKHGKITIPLLPFLSGKITHLLVEPLGILTEQQYSLAVACNGKKTIFDIAEEFDMPVGEVDDLLQFLHKKKIIKFKSQVDTN